MRLIDADNLTELCDIMADKCEGIGEGVWRQFRVTVEWCPTIEANQVRHGHWTRERLVSVSGGTYAVIRCSECKWQHPMWETKFCPNCGAKMDGGTT